MADRATCQNGRNRAKSAKMAGCSKSHAKWYANMATANLVPKNLFFRLFFFVDIADI